MTKNTWNRIGLMCLMLLLLGGQLHRLPAQHIRIQIKVPPKLALEDTRMLDFGTIQDTGWIHINRNDPRVGAFAISNQENVKVQVSVYTPTALELDQDTHLPIRLEASWLNDGTSRPWMAVPFNPAPPTSQIILPAPPITSLPYLSEFASFILSDNVADSQSASENESLTAWVYLSGSLYVGELKPGVYQGQVYVTIEYE